MNKPKIIAIMFLLLFLFANVNATATTWTSLDFGGKASVSEADPPPSLSWTSLDFGGKAEVQEYTWGAWSGWWMFTLINFTSPSDFSATTYTNASINLSWTKNPGASATEIRVQKGSYPNWGQGSLIYNGSGVFYSHTGLDIGTRYYYKAWSFNSTEGRSSDNATDTAYTKPGETTNFQNTSVNANTIDLSWTKGTNASRTVIRYQTGSYPSSPIDGTHGYNGTGSVTTLSSLSANTTFYIRAWGFVNPFSEEPVGLIETTLETFTPDPPYNGSIDYFTGGMINITWMRGNFSDEDVVVRKASGYPSDYTDGVVVDRTNNNTGTHYYHNTSVTQAYYFCVFSYNTTNLSYSSPLQIPQYSALGLNCFNESNPSQAIHFDALITNQDASQAYYASDISNTYWISIEDIPYGDDTVFLISNSSYEQRQYYYDINVGTFYNLTFYLPPKETSAGGGTSGEGTLRAYANVISVSNPAVNLTIPLTYTLESIIEVSVYNVLYDEQVKTDAKTVSNPAVNLTIPLTYKLDDIISVETYDVVYENRFKADSVSVSNPGVNATIAFTETWDSIIGVYVWNSSIYGGWVTVPNDKYSTNDTHCEIDDSVMDDNTTIAKVEYYYLAVDYGQWNDVPNDKYSYNSTEVEIDDSAMDSNTTMARVQYYYLQAGGGQWVTVPEDMYSASATQVEIDDAVLTVNTTMAKADYYYMSYENETTETKLYILKVIDDFDVPVEDAKVTISRYISTTGAFEPVTILMTDGNGQVECYLIPYNLYKVFIEADDFYDLEISEWIPDAEFYGIYYPKTFRVNYELGDDNVLGSRWDNILWDIDPDFYYHNGTFNVWFNITSSDFKLEWFSASLYWYNSTNMSWVLLNHSNVSASPGGGSISFVAPNVTGRYSFTCSFKKENYTVYTFGAEEGCRIHWVYWDYVSMAVATIPDVAYLLITIIFTLLVIGFLVKFGAGANAGFAGLCVMGGMFALRPDLAFGNPAISVWYMFIVTVVAYLIVMFLNRS